MYTFSTKRQQRDELQLAEQLAKARLAVREGLLMGNGAANGWRSFVQTAKEAAESREDKAQYRAVGIKEALIEKRRACAGYAAIVYQEAVNTPEQNIIFAQEVLGTYRHLVRIEDQFLYTAAERTP